ncbi:MULTISPECIES: CpaD family pilus assembly lipoprotein [Bradyrhizobium]|uniref:Pilus assembly protein CpaD n=3 Tax=Bradyrhizobium TaxID=374 RepID=A0AAE6CC86_9BRAD|nr:MULTISPECIES: CpaD family pilus assembly lipoprotein [Bradyrhizobium]MCG2632862.1 CpaD family pilus assembly lipoprotein [Bradyrhizobium zhengyangense]MCG2645475.1 CpaD family pilus assembly lipoprotein [Bradyrhizobium zhengyangense]MCG2673034.1 CpaD family pilus assembly lipoprotein [Bradyrhizobium zhengyangense]MDN4984439.1 CpaD family pilus assembly lipoprotein [Bradyrhizobium sp. WYCCWR 13022]MDN5002432.1 CpaD family pilus assembly lipoprotein [Bradyrhizobium sp. WYCCWR 12677]
MTLRNLGHLIAVAATVGGCTHNAAIYSEPTDQAIQVEQKTSILRLQSLRRAERYGLRNFIANASRGRRDALHLDVSGSPRLITQVAHEAREMGVPAYNIRRSASPVDLPSHFGVQIEAIIYEARPPLCPSLSIIGPSVDDNSFNPTLGCSIRNNLAVTVNDPGDLLENRAILPTSGDRAVLPLTARGGLAAGNKSHLESDTHNRIASEAQ